MDNYDLKILKKHYGEKFAHLCRTLFPDVLSHEGLLSKIVMDNFAPSKNLYLDIAFNGMIRNAFNMFIYSQVDLDKGKVSDNLGLTVRELFEKIGYTLYECKTEDEIQKFKKFYAPNEELCTFNEKRLETHYVFFAVKVQSSSFGA